MQPNELDIEIGKSYPASQILEKVNKSKENIILGHIIIEQGRNTIHDYYIDKKKLIDLKDSKIKVLHIESNPATENFAIELLERKDIKELLEKIKENPSKYCIIEKTDLVIYDYSSISQVTKLINKVFKSKDMPFNALNSKEKIIIKYKKKSEVK